MRILVAVAVLAAAILLLSLRSPPAPPPPTPPPSPSAPDGEAAAWWPTAPGSRWDYRVREGTSPFQRRRYLVQGREAAGTLVFEFSDDKQSDAFTLRAEPDGSLRLREFRAARKELLYLPAELAPGSSWELSPDLKARASNFEDLEVPGRPGPMAALRVEYQARYDARQTEEPGWYPDGVRWFVRGIGMVREDLREAKAPKELSALIGTQRRLLVLEAFELPGH